jgi:hypothetical protein
MTLEHPFALRDVLPWQLERGAYAYENYRKAVHGRSPVTGDELPDWKYLHPDVMRGWIEAACAVCSRFGAIY